jgi:ferric-dicitrate binding protein FerR (iron transport regulator)
VRWLENNDETDETSDEALARLRKGFDLSADRTDELALRRVWGRLQEIPMGQSRRLRPLVVSGGLTLAAGAAAGFLVMSLRVPEIAPAQIVLAPESPVEVDTRVPVLLGPATLQTGTQEAKRVRLKGGAMLAVSPRSRLEVDAGQRPRVTNGRVGLEVPRQPPGEQFTVEAGPYMIVVVGTKFDVSSDDRQVDVAVKEGVVEVWRDGHMVRLTAGETWQGLVDSEVDAAPASQAPRRAVRAVAPAMTAQQIASERFDEAKRALASGDTSGGLTILRELAEGKGATAENSSYEVGLVLRDRLDQPREAVRAWKRYRERFPNGLLRAETDLSVIETELTAGNKRAALTEAEAFLSQHSQNERRDEVRELVKRLRALDPAPHSAPTAAP